MNFTDLLGSLVQNGISKSGRSRVTRALEGTTGGSLDDLIGGLGQMMGGSGSGSSGLGGMLGDVLSGAGSAKTTSLGGLGALAGAILGGGGKATRGAIGGGSLAMLASLALKALQSAGKKTAEPPRALFEPQTDKDREGIEEDASIIVKAMINAAKADGQIDEKEVEKIIGKLDDDGLTPEEKQFFLEETKKPVDLNGIIASVGNREDMAAQVYAASLLAIEVDTVTEQNYLDALASGLGLPEQSVVYIKSTLGLMSA